ncbi:MAG: methyltransferase domain-containing protein [Xanthomonadales bacterium]|nr:methyltransferase domain-containing protein [Xanthomonadales bacterium]
MTTPHPRLAELLSRDWFYPFQLPGGEVTPTYDGGRLNAVHSTRLAMMDAALEPLYGSDYSGARVVDLACHQGYFALELARRGAREVLGVDARQEHVDDASLMAEVLGHHQFSARQSDIHALETGAMGRFDICLMLGLIYHLENPVGAIRTAHALTGRVCFIETQVVPHLSGNVDWGNYRFVKPLQGCFGIIDETDETHGPEASTQGICLAPSTEGLLWIMHKVGFDRVELLEPPADAYEQHRFGKRVMVAGYRDA